MAGAAADQGPVQATGGGIPKKKEPRDQGDPFLTRALYGMLAWLGNPPPQKKGLTQSEWLRLSRSRPAPVPRSDITPQEIRRHCTKGDCWVLFMDKVYDVSAYLPFHPGGADMLMKAAGRDCTSLFMKHHPWVNIDALLQRHFIGTLAGSQPASATTIPQAQQPPQQLPPALQPRCVPPAEGQQQPQQQLLPPALQPLSAPSAEGPQQPQQQLRPPALQPLSAPSTESPQQPQQPQLPPALQPVCGSPVDGQQQPQLPPALQPVCASSVASSPASSTVEEDESGDERRQPAVLQPGVHEPSIHKKAQQGGVGRQDACAVSLLHHVTAKSL